MRAELSLLKLCRATTENAAKLNEQVELCVEVSYQIAKQYNRATNLDIATFLAITYTKCYGLFLNQSFIFQLFF